MAATKLPPLAELERRFSPEDLEGFRLAFKEFDTDGSGDIDSSELDAVMKELGMNLSPEEIEEMISHVDQGDGDGTIDWQEFLFLMAEQADSPTGKTSKLKNLVAAVKTRAEEATKELGKNLDEMGDAISRARRQVELLELQQAGEGGEDSSEASSEAEMNRLRALLEQERNRANALEGSLAEAQGDAGAGGLGGHAGARYKARLAELEAENAELKAENERLRRIIEHLKAQLEKLMKKYPGMGKAISGLLAMANTGRSVFERLYQDAKDRWCRVKLLQDQMGQVQERQVMRVMACFSQIQGKTLKELQDKLAEELVLVMSPEELEAKRQELIALWPTQQEYPPIHNCICEQLKAATRADQAKSRYAPQQSSSEDLASSVTWRP